MKIIAMLMFFSMLLAFTSISRSMKLSEVHTAIKKK